MANKQLPDNSEFEPIPRSQILLLMGITAILWLIVAKLVLYFSSIRLLPLYWTWYHLLIGTFLGVAIASASFSIYRLWPAYRQSADTFLSLVLKPLILPDLIWLGLLPGFSEELLFRGVILPALGLNASGAIISGIWFGVFHFSSPQQWPYVIWASLIGIVLGFAAIETGNLLVPIAAHIINNIISSYVWKTTNQSN